MSLINQVLQDLEKRHASETELKALPPHVRAVPVPRQSPSRSIAIAAVVMVAVVLIGAAAYVFTRRVADETSQPPKVATAPVSEPSAPPVQAPPPSMPQPMPVAAEPPTFNPVSRLSSELSLVEPSSGRREKPAIAPTVAKPLPARAPAPVARLEEKPQQRPVEEPKPELAPKLPAPVEPVPVPLSAAANEAPAAIDKQMREAPPSERAEIAFRRGVAQIQEGRASAAELDFREALKLDQTHAGARQALLGLLLEARRNNEAEQLLRKALDINPRQPRHAMVLARLEVERGEVAGAINTMVAALPYVQSDPEFYAFLAALLQKEGRHREATDYYRTALRGNPGNGVWMMGLGISLRASNQSAEARDVFQHALETRQLSPELHEFVERQLRELSEPRKK
ncbi:MAG TPA: tetratricopeptide repeat protein [Burkholderiales bacterium]|nr:tetratricopeptide repeat protein [Burkholderiales bacterium]